MDFSKTTLQDLDTKKTDKSVCESQNQGTFVNNPCANRISHDLIEDQRCKYELTNNFNTESKYHMESCDDKQNAVNLKYKQLEPCEVQKRYSSNDITSVHRIGVSSDMSDLTDIKNTDLNLLKYGFVNKTNTQSVDQDSKFEKISTLEDVINKLSPISNLCDKKIIVKQLNNDNILTSPDASVFLQETNTNVAKTIEFQKELKSNEMVDDAETIEKIAEMIAISSKNSNENNPKTKKRLQMLMSRNCAEQGWNSSVENIESNSCSDSTISPLKINADDSDPNKNKVLTDPIHRKRKFVVDSQIGSGNATEKIENNETSEENFLVKSRFEEIEDKLEEMFAGIEDEQLVNTTTDDKNVSKKPILNSTNKCINANCTDNNTNNKREIFVDNCLKYETFISNKSPHPTKAAKKSTTSFSSNEDNKQDNTLLIDENNPTITKSMLYLKTMPPRRRLSIGMNVELLKFSVATNNEINEKKTTQIVLNKEEDMTPNPLNVLKHKEVKNVRKDNGKSKIINDNKNGSKYKKEISYIKSNNRNNKKKVLKTEASSKTKQSRQKINQRRIQRLLSSDNDNATEEKALQTRDIETKHRSPFILVKNNGSITVVNTVAADDSNEKWTRSKKTSNYTYERKTVKGCHSSTLSNRYDADTADSSWICVFCKIGPHKKGLGDLFGPYIISSDCDEYRCNKDSTENFEKNRRIGVPYINFSKKSVKNINDSLISDNQNISECNDDHLSNSYMLGMSQISDDCFEIWIHEECAIWAPNIFVIGSRLVGLEDATWNSMRYECVYCFKQGALLCCLQRDCKTTSHVPCAREFKWLLDESRFWAYCNKHVVNKF